MHLTFCILHSTEHSPSCPGLLAPSRCRCSSTHTSLRKTCPLGVCFTGSFIPAPEARIFSCPASTPAQFDAGTWIEAVEELPHELLGSSSASSTINLIWRPSSCKLGDEADSYMLTSRANRSEALDLRPRHLTAPSPSAHSFSWRPHSARAHRARAISAHSAERGP